MTSLRFLTFMFWNYYILKFLRLEAITFSDAMLSDINVVLCYVLSQYQPRRLPLHGAEAQRARALWASTCAPPPWPTWWTTWWTAPQIQHSVRPSAEQRLSATSSPSSNQLPHFHFLLPPCHFLLPPCHFLLPHCHLLLPAFYSHPAIPWKNVMQVGE